MCAFAAPTMTRSSPIPRQRPMRAISLFAPSTLIRTGRSRPGWTCRWTSGGSLETSSTSCTTSCETSATHGAVATTGCVWTPTYSPRTSCGSNVPTAETLRAARWFGGKSRPISDTRIVDRACLADGAPLELVEVRYESGPSETYVLVEHVEDPIVARAVLRHFDGATLPTERGGRLVFRPTHLFQVRDVEPIKPLSGEQSNTSIRFGDALILKLFRRLQFGPNPDVEIGWFLTEHTAFRGTPPMAGSISYTSPNGDRADLALLQRFEANHGDAWTTTLARLRRGDVSESIEAARRLGTTTAELHLALASGSGDFAAEPITGRDLQEWSSGLEHEVHLTAEALSARGIRVDSAPLMRRADGLHLLQGALKTRHHGDYHLGQVLERDDGSFAIIDFEGEPSRPLAQRREKRTPLRDVAGMLRSFDYARHTVVRNGGDPALAASWYTECREGFLNEYLSLA